MNDLCAKGIDFKFKLYLGSKMIPSSITNMMTMQTQYKSKVPNNGKKFKKKDCNSTATFRKMMGLPNNYLTVGNDNCKQNKNKSSRSRLKTVDSKGKLISARDNKTTNHGDNTNGNLNDTNELPSSGKKKK